MSPEEEVARAGRAREILEAELFKEACSEILTSITSARINSPAKDVEFREKLWAQEVALHSILEKLRVYLETGELAQEQIRQASLAERAKQFFQIN